MNDVIPYEIEIYAVCPTGVATPVVMKVCPSLIRLLTFLGQLIKWFGLCFHFEKLLPVFEFRYVQSTGVFAIVSRKQSLNEKVFTREYWSSWRNSGFGFKTQNEKCNSWTRRDLTSIQVLKQTVWERKGNFLDYDRRVPDAWSHFRHEVAGQSPSGSQSLLILTSDFWTKKCLHTDMLFRADPGVCAQDTGFKFSSREISSNHAWDDVLRVSAISFWTKIHLGVWFTVGWHSYSKFKWINCE